MVSDVERRPVEVGEAAHDSVVVVISVVVESGGLERDVDERRHDAEAGEAGESHQEALLPQRHVLLPGMTERLRYVRTTTAITATVSFYKQPSSLFVSR